MRTRIQSLIALGSVALLAGCAGTTGNSSLNNASADGRGFSTDPGNTPAPRVLSRLTGRIPVFLTLTDKPANVFFRIKSAHAIEANAEKPIFTSGKPVYIWAPAISGRSIFLGTVDRTNPLVRAELVLESKVLGTTDDPSAELIEKELSPEPETKVQLTLAGKGEFQDALVLGLDIVEKDGKLGAELKLAPVGELSALERQYPIPLEAEVAANDKDAADIDLAGFKMKAVWQHALSESIVPKAKDKVLLLSRYHRETGALIAMPDSGNALGRRSATKEGLLEFAPIWMREAPKHRLLTMEIAEIEADLRASLLDPDKTLEPLLVSWEPKDTGFVARAITLFEPPKPEILAIAQKLTEKTGTKATMADKKAEAAKKKN